MASKGRSFRATYIDEFEVLIGKGAAENDTLTFREADPYDFWPACCQRTWQPCCGAES